jgi:predicted AAA+ superfamily ATPase
MTISKIEKINPYDYIRPVVNRDLFAGRREELQTIHEEIQKLTGEVWNSPIIALLGNRRVGKTSILLRIEEMCEEEGLISARIAVTRASKANEWDFWRNIFLVINRSLQKKGFSKNRYY